MRDHTTGPDANTPLRLAHPTPESDNDYDDPYNQTTNPLTDPTAEKALLGALLLAPQYAPQAAQELQPGDFYQPRHETIWTAIHSITDHPADPITLAAQLTKQGQLQKIGGANYLHDLITACPNPANLGIYAAEVRNQSRRRQLHQTATKLQTLATKGNNLEDALADALQTLDQTAARLGPATLTPANTGLTDLTWLLNGQPPHIDPPTYVKRQDGHALFYPGRVNGIYGDPESAKSWLAQHGCVEALTAGQKAAIIDVDHNGQQLTTERLLLLGATKEQLANPDQFRYYEPDDAQQLLATITDLTTWQPAITILDSIGEMMPMLGIKSIDNDELSGALRTIASPLARIGSCVITIDHLPKSPEARITGFAIGGTAKKRAIDGSYIHAEARTQPAPGQLGKISLRIEKDRPGRLRENCTGKYIGTYTLDSRTPGKTISTISNDSPITSAGIFRPTGLMEAVSRHIEDNDQCSFRDIKTAVSGKDSTLRAAIERLIQEGFVAALDGPKRSTIHHTIAMYREDQDDQA